MKQDNLTGYPSADKPWLKHYNPDHVTAPLPTETLYEYLEASNRNYPDDIAIHYLNKDITYGELLTRIDQCTRAFMALGVRRNDIVTLAMPNTPEMVYAVYALNRLGAVSNMIHPLAGADEICKNLNEVSSRVFLMFTGTYAIVKDKLSQTCVEKAIVVSPVESLSPVVKLLYRIKNGKEKLANDDERILSWKQFISGGQTLDLPAPQRADNDMAFISHTGGTTGDSKSVICSNLNFIAIGYQILEKRGGQRQDCTMIHLPPFINYSLTTAITSFSSGFRVLLIPHYKPEKMADYAYHFKVSFILSIPAYFEALLRVRDIPKDAFSSLKAVVSGGENMDVKIERKVNHLLRTHGSPYDLDKGLGMTELTCGVTQTFPDCNDEGSVGIPYIKTNCRIVEVGTDDEKTYDEIGEICYSTPSMMIGYYGNKQATDEIIHTDADGTRWLHSGDLGYITRDGVIYVVGRIKRLIMIKDKDGLITKIFPDRIEQVINAHPAVDVSCVVGVPDEQCIAWPKAFIVLHENVEASQDVKDAILAHCSQSLPHYMVPRNIVFIEEMPRTDRGKIDYKQLEQASIEG